VELAVEYAVKHGLATLQDVPYRGEDGQCRHESLLQRSAGAVEKHDNEEDGSSIGLASWSTLPMNKAEPLMRALATGPVAVSVGADHWMFYQNGVFDSCTKDSVINHAVLMVGYGTDKEDNANYWKIQNSWGNSFGERGYMRLLRQKTVAEEDAFCGIDRSPGDGIECKPYPETVPVCGQCGILYDSVAPVFGKKKVTLNQAFRGVIRKV
jgi:KDEL-tailed cysteine endopeptidase